MRSRFILLTLALVAAVIQSGLALSQDAAPPAAAWQCQANPYSGSRVALVVGTDDYSTLQEVEIRNLANARNDARKIGEVLASQGFAVRCLIDPTNLVFDKEVTALHNYLQTANPAIPSSERRAVVYVAGHGFKDPGDGRDYLLLKLETDTSKYASPNVDFSTLAGRVEQSRYSIQGLVSSFNAAPEFPVLFIFDACRALINIARLDGVAVRGEAIRPIPIEKVIANRIVAYSAGAGGVAADSDVASFSSNGLYTAFLSQFINQPGLRLDRLLRITGLLVQSYNDQQRPDFVDRIALFADKRWVNRNPTGMCEMVNASIWESIECTPPRQASCVIQDVCPLIKEALRGPNAGQMAECLKPFKTKWLKVDLPSICTGEAANNVRPAFTVVRADLGPRLDGGRGPVSVPATPTPNTPISRALIGYTASTMTNFTTDASAVVNTTAKIENTLFEKSGRTKTVYVNRVRDELLAKTEKGAAAKQEVVAPYSIRSGTQLAIRNLPAANAGLIGTFNNQNQIAEIDCSTIKCFDNWVGIRVNAGKTTIRGWAPVGELMREVRSDIKSPLKYSDGSVLPDEFSLTTLLLTLGINRRSGVAGRVQIVAHGQGTTADEGSFLAVARLAFLRRKLIEIGIAPNEIIQTVVEGPVEAGDSPVSIYFASAERTEMAGDRLRSITPCGSGRDPC